MKIAEFVTRANIYKNLVISIQVIFVINFSKNLDAYLNATPIFYKSLQNNKKASLYRNLVFGMVLCLFGFKNIDKLKLSYLIRIILLCCGKDSLI
jgi:hypothetical protein